MNILKRNYFVCATIKTRKKGSGKIAESVHNGIVQLWFWQKKDNETVRNLSLTFASNVAATNEDLEVKGITITAFNKV